MKLAFAVIVLLIVTKDPVSPMRIIDRYPSSRLPRCRCRIAFPDTMQYGSIKGQISTLFEKQGKQLSAMNCTLVSTDFLNSGLSMDANGSYDGMAGMIQRDEIDVTPYLYRSDFFVNPPGLQQPTGVPADVDIIMKKNKSVTVSPGLIEVWSSEFDLITVQFIFISIFMFITVLSFTSSPSFEVTVIINSMWRNFQKSVLAIMDQENFEAEDAASRISVLFFNLFLLFAVHGILFGVIGAEMVFDVDHPIYESLGEFSNESWVQPTVIHNLWLLPVLEKTEPGSSLWPLKEAVFAHPETNLLKFEIKDQYALAAAATKLFDDVHAGTRALIVPRFIAENTRDILCTLFPERMKEFSQSKNAFAEGILVTLMSYKIHPLLRKFIGYLTLTSLETGLSKGTFRMIHLRIYEGNTIDKSDTAWQLKKNKCLEGFLHEKMEPAAFGIPLFAPIFWQLAIALVGALIVLITEIICVFITGTNLQFRKTVRRTLVRQRKRIRKKVKKVRRVLRWLRRWKRRRRVQQQVEAKAHDST